MAIKITLNYWLKCIEESLKNLHGFVYFSYSLCQTFKHCRIMHNSLIKYFSGLCVRVPRCQKLQMTT